MVRYHLICGVREGIQLTDSIVSSGKHPEEATSVYQSNNDMQAAHHECWKQFQNGNVRKKQGTLKQASYIPSYVRIVQLKKDNAETANGLLKKCYRRASYAGYSTRKYSYSENIDAEPNRSLNRLKKYKTSATQQVHVKDAVAAMEARIVPLRKPLPVVVIKPASENNRLTPNIGLSRKARHRRSMSDPNLQKTFREVKKLWDQKVELEKLPSNSNTPNDSRRGSSSSVNSIGSTKSVDRKQNIRKGNGGENLFKPKMPVISVTNTDNVKLRSSSIGERPVVAPRPNKSRRMRGGTLNGILDNSDANVVTVQTSPSPALSVNQKAKMFGEILKKPASREENGRTTSPAFRRHYSEETSNHTTEIKEQSSDRIRSHERVQNSLSTANPDVAKKINQTIKSWKVKEDSQTSNHSSTDHVKNEKTRDDRKLIVDSMKQESAEEQQIRKSSFLHNVRRISQDSHASQSPTVERRRTSSLHHKMNDRNRSSGSFSSMNSSSPMASPSTTKVLELPNERDVAVRPSSLSLGRRQRSNTAVESRSNFRESLSGKLSQSTKSVTASTVNTASKGDKHNRETLPSRPKAPEPPPKWSKPTVCSIKRQELLNDENNTGGSVESVDSNDTDQRSTPCLSEFNLEEEYDKIARQIQEDDQGLQISTNNIGLTSSTSSTTSMDSGFRNSLDVLSSNQSSSRAINTDSWSDFDNSSDDDSILNTPKQEFEKARTPSPSFSIKEPAEVKLHNIVKELLSTEESYVAVLHLIDQVFHKQVREAAVEKHIMPEQVVNSIFFHLPAIYKFHSSFLLPHLKERVKNWETDPRIGDIMTQAAPFLKMYSLYVQNFDEAMNLIKIWSDKSSAFSNIIKTIQKRPESNFLTLQHHMLGPVQRVPRYRMLLDDYVKRLPADSEDKSDAEVALNLITLAATHSNETMRNIEKFNKLVKIFNGLSEIKFDIVDVSRELLKEGKIIKISARNGEKHERYLYLFNDMLLCCSPLGILQGKSYRVTAKIDLDGMRLTEVKNPTVPNAFCVEGLQKSMEFALSTPEEKEIWLKAISNAIDECIDRKTSFIKKGSFKKEPLVPEEGVTLAAVDRSPGCVTPTHERPHPLIDIAAADLGTRAPRWIKDNEVTMCMTCSKPFNKLIRRRHHCRACGKVVCSKCSMHETTLQYDPDKPQKVCEDCYKVLSGSKQDDSPDGEKKGVLEVEADIVSENSVIANYLLFTENEKRKTWTKTWCVIPNEELCLYFYGAHQDVRAQMTMPLPGFKVIDVTSINDHKYCFKLAQARKVFFFATEKQDVAERWMYALNRASIGEDLTKDDVYRLGMPEALTKLTEGKRSDHEENSVDVAQDDSLEQEYKSVDNGAETEEQEMRGNDAIDSS